MRLSPSSSFWSALRNWRGSGKRALLATVVRTWGSSPRPVAAYVSGLFYVLTVPVVYLIGMRSFGQRAGVIAAAAFAASTTMLDYSISGLPNPFYMFLVACLALAIHSVAIQSEETKAPSNGRLNRSGLVWVGLLTAALYLANPIFAWCLPIVGITVVFFFPARLRVHAGLMFCVSLLLVLPWMLRNYSLSGNPVFGLRGAETWMGTGSYPGYIAYRYLMNDTIAGKTLFLGVAKKLVKQFFSGVQILPGTPFSLLLIFLIPSLLFRFSDSAANAVRRGVVAVFLGVFLGVEFFVMEPALLAVVAPVMLVFSAAFLLYLWDQAQLRGSTAIVAAALLSLPMVCSLANNFFLEDPSAAPADKPAAVAFGAMVKKAHGSNVVLSDQPWIVAWYSGVPSIWIPAESSKIGSLKSKFPTIHWVFLTQQVRQYEPEWQRVYGVLARWNAIYEQAAVSGQYPPNIQLTEVLPSLTGFQPVPPVNRGAAVTAIATDTDPAALQTTAVEGTSPRTP